MYTCQQTRHVSHSDATRPTLSIDVVGTSRQGVCTAVEYYAVVPMEKIEHGWKCRLTAYTQPENVEFEMYHLSNEVYEKNTAEAGLVGLMWNWHLIPEDWGQTGGYWDAPDKDHRLRFVLRGILFCKGY